ncbi:MAG: hypothetical protein E7638_05895 [Ruminococcaceae bacterium]|nr:hypothetical protein [Oscillospiraceae bacterium]
MKIGDIDKNLKVETNIEMPEMMWLTPLDKPISLHGIYRYTTEDGYIRMPLDTAFAANPGTHVLAHHTAGGRIRFRTNSKYIAAKVITPSRDVMPHITAVGQSGFDVYIDDNRHPRYFCSAFPSFREEGDAFCYDFIRHTDGETHTYTINMPLYSGVKAFYIGFEPDSVIEEAEKYTIEQPIVYYGSSITQGGCASRPGNAYQALLSRRFDCDFLNLGFSGSARGEPAMAEYLASLDPSIFVMDYDYNAPSPDHLRETHEPLFKAFRAAHPLTPVIMVTCPDFRTTPNLIERREIIRTTYENARNSGDGNVHFINGETLFEGEFRDSCTVDGCHPNDLGFFRMAQVIGNVMEPIIEALKA